MPDLTITPANVIKGSSGQEVIEVGIAGTTITAGQPIYKSTTDSKWYLAQCDGTALESGFGTTLAISLHGALADQPLSFIRGGQLALGAILTVGTIYVVSATAGGIAPLGDLVSTNRVSLLGIGYTTSNLLFLNFPLGIEIA